MERAIEGLDYRGWTEPSDSRPDLNHYVRLWLRDYRGFKAGTMSCDCEAWKYSKKPLSEKECRHTIRRANRLRPNEVITLIQGSEVTFNEEAVAKRIKTLPPSNEDLTTARVRALAKALQEEV